MAQWYARKPPEPPSVAGGRARSRPALRDVGRALRHRNYRLFFAGQSISLIGTWLTRVATSWLVYRLTHSALLLGVVGFAGQIPTFFLAPFAGVWVDRWNRHRMLVVTQVLAMLQSAVLAVLALTGMIDVASIIALNVMQGLINAFDMPARQAFVVEMIDRSRRSAERNRAQFLDGQRRAPDRSLGRGRCSSRGRRGLVFRHRRGSATSR